MKFRISIYVSVCAHVVALGSALAFAQFAGRAMPAGPRSILVSLVSPPAGPAAKSAPVRQQRDRPPAEQQRSAEPRAVHRNEDPKMPATVVPEPRPAGEATESVDEPPQETKEGNDDGAQEEPAPADAGKKSSGSGFAEPEQWALIKAAIERNKRYPRFARERGIEGEVRLRFRLASSGEIDAVEILKSSGSDILDRASVRAVYRAAPMPYVDGWIEVPMAYVIK